MIFKTERNFEETQIIYPGNSMFLDDFIYIKNNGISHMCV